MNTPFEIQPYVGVGPLKFGMTADEVAAELGVPNYIRNRGDEIRELRKKMISTLFMQRTEREWLKWVLAAV